MMSWLQVFGHTTVDHIADLPHLPRPNESTQANSVKRAFGGTAANIARLAAGAGVDVGLSSFVGPDFPDDFMGVLVDAGIDLRDLRKVEGERTPGCWMMSDPDQNQTAVMDQGAMGKAGGYDVLESVVREAEVVHVATGRPEYFAKVMTLASRLGKKLAFDPAQEINYVYTPETFTSLLDLSDIFFANRTEMDTALRFTGLEGPEALLNYVDVVVMTRGKDGSDIWTEGKHIDVPAIPPEKVADPTGAGDAYRAGFYAGMSRGLELDACGLAGAALSSIVLENVGAQGGIPTWEEVAGRAGL